MHRDKNNTYSKGFTIVELLIVVVVIAILAAITIVAFNGVQARARDARRGADTASIKKALMLYDNTYGGVPQPGPSKYTGTNTYAGWDSSTSPTWLAFLNADNGKMPLDPTNSRPNADASNPTNRNYFYYCYNAGTGPNPATANVRLGYQNESGANVLLDFPVTSCL